MKTFNEFVNESYLETDAIYDSIFYDLAAEVYDLIDYKDIENKTKVKSALKKLGKSTDPLTVGMVIRKMKEVTNESELFEGDINLQTDNFALVRVGGSIRSKNSIPVYAGGKMGIVIETGNDKEVLKEKAKSRRKSLSAGEKSYYGMNYVVIALTSAKRIEIDYLYDIQKKSETDKIEESQLFESVGTIALGIMVAYVGLKVIGYIGRKILGTIGMNVNIEPEKLKEIVQEIVFEAASKTGTKVNLLQTAVIINALNKSIDAGEIKTLDGVKKYMETYTETELNEENFSIEDGIRISIFEEMIFENEAAIKKSQSEIEKNMKVKLSEIYNSIKDKNPDEEFGNYITYEIILNGEILEENGEPLVINIYEDGTAQFFHDATPYPVFTNTPAERNNMMNYLNPVPKPIKDFKEKELLNFIEQI
jgi:hypothetical protein